jgi:hypothetical protein
MRVPEMGITQVLADWAIDRVTRPRASKLYEDPPTP